MSDISNLSWGEIESNAVAFSRRWKDSLGNEKQEANTFEKDLMSVYGVDWREGLHEYQVRNAEGRIGYIDYLLPGKILIEMKSKGESLIGAYNQAYDYSRSLRPEDYPQLLLVSDFEYMQITNLETMQTFKKFKVSQLKKYVRMLGTLAGYNSEITFKTDIEVNTDASYKMAKLHDALKKSGYYGKDLEIYLVRLLFCLFAEDTGIFEEKAFEEYIRSSSEDGSDLSAKIIMLFDILDTDESERMTTLPEDLKKFRYINGKLFSKSLPPAYFNSKMRETLIDCCNFDWSYISPAIFGAMFQGVMNPEERRELGAHYTSEENIMKVIKPLFLDELWEEFENSKSTKVELEQFHKKLSTLKFLDPACGCGNFLIVIYREIRILEFEVLKMIHDNEQTIIIDTFCEISIEQFYGIEYEEFPSQIAGVGLLLMKHQMDKITSNYFGKNIIDFPIKEGANIVHGNALQIDWNDIVESKELSYIVGNPPFIGARLMSSEQKEDMVNVFGDKFKKLGNLDYVTAWYYKAAKLMQYSYSLKTAFVSTNSICQGEQVSILWKPLFEEYNMKIDYSYRTFKWSNEAKGKAAVYCIIVGFSSEFNINSKKFIVEGDNVKHAKNINAYLVDAPNVFIDKRKASISDVPECVFGNMPNDGGNLLFIDEEKKEFVLQYPKSEQFIKEFYGASDFINNKKRWCLWLVDVSANSIKNIKGIYDRVLNVKEFRESSKRKATNKLASTPTLFGEIRQPQSDYILIPRHSSERRKYVPIGFMSKDIICGDSNMMVKDATLYHFGILTSNVHNAWMRAVGGRIKSDYRYSKNIIYNSFPWPEVSEIQKETIEEKAKQVIDARNNHPGDSLADLYDPLFMPLELVEAHRELDREVGRAYGNVWTTEEECISDLMIRYSKLTCK